MSPAPATLVFDGDCGFCKRTAEALRWRVGEQLEVVAHQELGERFAELPRTDFAEAVHLIDGSGRAHRGAEAVFAALALKRGLGGLLACHRRIPGFAPISEWVYEWVARNRILVSGALRLVAGPAPAVRGQLLTRRIFLAGLAVIHLIAFASLWVQLAGLVGSSGISPAAATLERVSSFFEQNGAGWFERLTSFPTLCWLSTTDIFLNALCAAGCAAAVLLAIGIAERAMLVFLWVSYLSLATVCDVFLGFQWDVLLLEATFLALFVAPGGLTPGFAAKRAPSFAGVFLLRWLLFRLMFGSGVVKLTSGDEGWWDLTALEFHYETQPLANPISWYAHHLPSWFQQTSVFLMFVVELVVPFLVFGPRRARLVAFWSLLGFQLILIATGNYGFFNLLTIVLCIPLLDDSLLPRRWTRTVPSFRLSSGSAVTLLQLLVALPLVVLSFFAMRARSFPASETPPAVQTALSELRGLRSINGYGLFADMTEQRPEIIIEGSVDGIEWTPYELPHKPGDPARAPTFVAPHMPRLDWQMWFAALYGYQRSPWVIRFMAHLLEGTPEVLALVEGNPFPDAPPNHVRARLFLYELSSPEEKAASGAWWTRSELGPYCPVLSRRE